MEAFLSAIGYVPTGLPVLVKLLFSTLMGAVLGLERTRKRRAAGIRTYSMVCVGACIVMMTGMESSLLYDLGDPMRLGAQVVSGIGFIGAGAIMKTGYHEVKGLTTAAGLWVVACLGLAIGAGYYMMAIAAGIILYLTIILGAQVQQGILLHNNRVKLLVCFDHNDDVVAFLALCRDADILVTDCEYLQTREEEKQQVIFFLEFPKRSQPEEAVDMLGKAKGVCFIERL